MSTKDFSDTKPMGLYEAAIGERNQNYYINKFEDFDDKGPGLHASWNWAAFFFTGFWALYRKMYGWFFAWWFIATVGTIFGKVPNSQIQSVVGLITLASLFGFSAYANSLYHRKVKAKIAAAQKSNSDASRVSRRLSAASGVNKWVPIVCGAVPVIGVLAAIALPAYQDYTKRQATSVNQAVKEPTPSPELKPFSGSLDEERKPNFSFTPEEDKRVLEDREIMKQQGIGGSQSLADVVAWGDAQLSARLVNDESGRRKAHDFALMWQTQIASKLQDSPEHSLFMGFRLVMNFYDEKRGICRPDMSMHGGVENLPGELANFYPECFTRR